MPLIIPIQIEALQEVASRPTAGEGIFKQWSLRFKFSNKRAEGKIPVYMTEMGSQDHLILSTKTCFC